MKLKDRMQRWLCSEIHRENAVMWQAIWDLRGVVLLMRKHGVDVRIKEIDSPEIRFFNSLEGKEVGSRFLVAHKENGDWHVYADVSDKARMTKEEISEKWDDLDTAEEERHFAKKRSVVPL